MAATRDTAQLLLQVDASVALAQRNLSALRNSVATDVSAMEGSLSRLSRSTGGVGAAFGTLKTTLAGLIAGLTVGVFTSGVKDALEYAGSLGELSQQIGVSAKDLQALRYMASQVGVDSAVLEKGLSKLTITLGQVAAGAEAPAKALKAIGISAADVAGKDTGEAFRLIADGLEKIPDRAQRAAVEVALFGKAGSQLDNVLSQGSRSINEYVRAAQGLGLILSDDDIRRADEASDKFAQLNTVLRVSWASTVAQNADSILQLADAFAKVIGFASKAIRQLEYFRERMNQVQGAIGQYTGGTPAVRSKQANLKIRSDENISRMQIEDHTGTTIDAYLARALAKPAPKPVGGDVDDFLAPEGGGGGGGKSAAEQAAEANRKREQLLRDDFNMLTDLNRARQDELSAQQDLQADYVDRTEIGKQLVDIEHDQRAAQIDLAVKLGDMSASAGAQLRARNDTLAVLKKEKLNLDQELQRQQEYARMQGVDFDITRERLQVQNQLAQTAAERRRIELQILDGVYEERRAQIERLKNSRDPADQEEGRRREAALPAQYQLDQRNVLQGTMGPMEEFLKTLPDTADKANEALQRIAADGLQSLTDGLTDAILGAKNLGDVFKNVAKQIIAELIKIQIQKSIIGPLSSALGGLGSIFGGSTGGGGSLGLAGARASGGPVSGGRAYLVGEKGPEIFAPSTSGMIIPNMPNVSMPRASGGGMSITVNVAANDAVLADTVRGWVADGVQVAVQAGAMSGASLAQERAVRSGRRRLGR